VAVVAALAALGYPVATVLAGLGIGGIALAFGAQKTIENLFGSIALAADQPFRVGDFVRIEDFVGNVERIGMRSTQIRTLDRTLITIPNGRLADMRIEDFASRDRIRLSATIGVVYGTTRAQIERIVAGMETVLRDHPLIWPDTVVVRFAGFGASSLDIEVMAWFRTSDFNVFRDCRQEALFGFMRVVEEAARASPSRRGRCTWSRRRGPARAEAPGGAPPAVSAPRRRRRRRASGPGGGDAAAGVRGEPLQDVEDRLRLVRAPTAAAQVEHLGGGLLARLDARLVVGVDADEARVEPHRARRGRSASRGCGRTRRDRERERGAALLGEGAPRARAGSPAGSRRS
jgi:hypothetical protein